MFQRLLFIKYLYEGDSVPQAADKVELTRFFEYEWRNRWNEQGYDSLVPQFDGGPIGHISSKIYS